MADQILGIQQIEMAELIAQGVLTYGEIGARYGITRQSVYWWTKQPAFAAKVEEFIEEGNAAIRRRAISHSVRRVDRLNRDWTRLQKVIEARAADASMVAPGSDTGLLVRKYKSIGSGPATEIVEEYEVDTATLKELREIEKQAAQELGQWVDRTTVDTTIKTYDVTADPDLL